MSEKKTVTISLENLEAIFEKCDALSPSEKKMLVANIRAHDETPAKGRVKHPFLSLYCVENSVTTSFRMPPPTAIRAFKTITTFEDALPYELNILTQISHLVVVTVSAESAVRLFDLLFAQKGLKICFLEFLILTGVARNGDLFEPPCAELIQKELERTALGNWGKDSLSIKIIRVRNSIDDELERHVRFVAESGSLRMIRGIDQQHRVISPLNWHKPPRNLEESSVLHDVNANPRISSENRSSTISEHRERFPGENEKDANRTGLIPLHPITDRVRRSRSRSPPKRVQTDPRLGSALQRSDKIDIRSQTDRGASASRDPRLLRRDRSDFDNRNPVAPGHHYHTTNRDHRSQPTSSRKTLLDTPTTFPRYK